MNTIVITLFALFALSSGEYQKYLTKDDYNKDLNFTKCFPSTDNESIYDFKIPHLNKSVPTIEFSKFKGKVVLLVNVATYCRSTVEYPQLNNLKVQFGDDLVIVAFPCSQFLNQEPGATTEEIYNGIKYVRPGGGFVPKFDLTEKVQVNGPDTHPIYSFLKRSCPATRLRFLPKEFLRYDSKNDRDVRWNFEKFLIHPDTGKPVYRYDEVYGPNNIIPHIKELLKLKKH